MNIKNLITDYLKEAKILQIATSHSNQPWICTVYFAYDDNWNLYWISLPTTRHSQEIQNNTKVAGAIVLPHKLGENVRGLQIEGQAKELKNPEEIKAAMKYYAARFNMDEKRTQEIINNTDGHSCYKIEPKLFVLFDTLNFPDNPRQEYKIKSSAM